jgi:hypothetical protein
MEIRFASPVLIGQRIADGRDQDWTFWRETRDTVEHAETLSSEMQEAVRLLDGYGRRKAPYSTLQAAVSTAAVGDQGVVSSVVIILRASGIQGSGMHCATLFRLPHVDD